MKRVILLVAALLVSATASATNTYYVDAVNGSNSYAGTSATAAWRTLAYANATMSDTASAILKIAAGNYSGQLAGATPGAGYTVTYEGNITSPSTITLPDTQCVSKNYVRIKGVTFKKALHLMGDRDSLLDCVIEGPVDWAYMDYSCVARNTFKGSGFRCQNDCEDPSRGCNGRGYQHAMSNDFNSNTFTSLGNPGTHDNFWTVIGADSSTFAFNSYTVNMPADGSGTTYWRKISFARYNEFRDENIYLDRFTGGEGMAIRDSVLGNSWDCDSLVERVVNPQWAYELSASGHWPRSVYSNSWDSCYVKINGSTDYRGVWFEDGFQKSKLTYTTFICGNAPALYIGDRVQGRSEISHCTFVGWPAHSGSYSAVVHDGSGTGWQDKLLFRDNIIYSLCQPQWIDADLWGSASVLGAVYYSPYRDSVFNGGGSDDNHLISDHNLYAYYGRSGDCATTADTVGKRSIGFSNGGYTCLHAWPGANPFLITDPSYSYTLSYKPSTGDTTFSVTQAMTAGHARPDTLWSVKWCAGCDDSSHYGSPLFMDSTFATFDPTPTTGSLAVGTASDGTDIGAVEAETGPIASFWPLEGLVFYVPVSARALYADITINNTSATDTLHISDPPNVDFWRDHKNGPMDGGGYVSASEDGGFVVGPMGSHSFSVEYDSYGLNTNQSSRPRNDSGTFWLDFETDDPVHPVLSVPVTVKVK